MRKESFDLSSSEYKRFDDGDYVYDLHNEADRLIIHIRSMHSMIRKAKPINISVPDNLNYYIDLSRCFYKHKHLIDLSELSSFDTSRVVNMTETFSLCNKLVSLEPLSNWDVSNVWEMSGTFHACWRLTDLKCLSGWKVRDDCILEAFYSNRGPFIEPVGPIIGLDGLGIRNNRTAIDRYLQAHFPQWLIDRHKARGY